ncbi:MAG: GLPGLI family protein [Bacteroidota bacterium]
MKTLFLFILSLTAGAFIQAQDQGTIHYLSTRTLSLDGVDLGEEAMEMIKSMLGENGIQDRATLQFQGQKSLYRPIVEAEQTRENGPMTVVIQRVGQELQFYTDWATKEIAYADNIFDQPFLIKDQFQEIDWQLDTETPVNMDYQLPAKRATATLDNGDEIVAWYSEAVPLPFGPRKYGGLPGIIVRLEEQSEDGLTTYEITQIDLETEVGEIKAPTTGRSVDRAKFAKLYEERMSNQDGPIMIRRSEGGRPSGF